MVLRYVIASTIGTSLVVEPLLDKSTLEMLDYEHRCDSVSQIYQWALAGIILSAVSPRAFGPVRGM